MPPSDQPEIKQSTEVSTRSDASSKRFLEDLRLFEAPFSSAYGVEKTIPRNELMQEKWLSFNASLSLPELSIDMDSSHRNSAPADSTMNTQPDKAMQQPDKAIQQSEKTIQQAEKQIKQPENGNTEPGKEHLKPEQENKESKQEIKESGKEKWTVLVQLGANPNGVDFIKQKADAIKSIASETKGKDVSIVIQELIPNPDKKGEFIDHYEVVKDGKITATIPDEKSSGLASDIEKLMQKGLALNPAEHVALVLNDHGDGNGGMHSDSDHQMTKTESVIDAIKNGLAGSGHTKLDLLDFDSCRMNEDGALALASQVTDNMVASAELECAPGQNLGKSIAKLLADPTMDGHEFGKSMVDNADEGGNVNGKRCGTQTLAFDDLRTVKEFETKLDQFGADLCASIERNPALADTIMRLADSSRAYGMDKNNGQEFMGQRDLNSFLQKLQEEMKNDKTLDPTGKIGKDICKLLDSEKSLVNQFHGETKGGYDKLGGLSVYLPGLQLEDKIEKAQNESATERSAYEIKILGNDKEQLLNSTENWQRLLKLLASAESCKPSALA